MAIYEQAGGEDRMVGGWRAIGSAWLLVLLVVALFAGFSALAARCEAWDRSPPALEHVVVPRHDPACDAAVTASATPCPSDSPFDAEGMAGVAPM